MIYTLTLAEVWPYLLVGGRLFGLISFFPGLSQGSIPYGVKFFLISSLTGALTPVIFFHPPLLPDLTGMSLILLGKEVATGILCGLALKAFFSALDTAGSIAGFQMSLANVFVNNAETSQQSGLTSAFLSLLATTLLFATHLHFMIIEAFITSFEGLKGSSAFSDYSHLFLDIFSSAFTLGLTLSGPLMIVSVLTYGMAGILNRLVPQMQVFFLIQPLQLFLGFSVLAMILPLSFETIMDKLHDLIQEWGGLQ